MGILIRAKEIYTEIMRYHWFFQLENGKIVKIILMSCNKYHVMLECLKMLRE